MLSAGMKSKIESQVVENINISPEILSRCANIKICGTRDIHIENYHKILKYENDEIILKDKMKKIIINGNNLVIRYFFDREIHINGNITTLKFERLYG